MRRRGTAAQQRPAMANVAAGCRTVRFIKGPPLGSASSNVRITSVGSPLLADHECVGRRLLHEGHVTYGYARTMIRIGPGSAGAAAAGTTARTPRQDGPHGCGQAGGRGRVRNGRRGRCSRVRTPCRPACRAPSRPSPAPISWGRGPRRPGACPRRATCCARSAIRPFPDPAEPADERVLSRSLPAARTALRRRPGFPAEIGVSRGGGFITVYR